MMDDDGDNSAAERAAGKPTSVQDWLSFAGDLGGQVGKVLLSHASSVLAFAGVGLYVIGVVRTIGILEAEDIPVSRGLPLAPLQDYLLRGLAVVVTPQALFSIVVIGAGLTFIILGFSPDLSSGSDSHEPPESPSRRESGLLGATVAALDALKRAIASIGLPLIAAAMLLIVPVAEWLPVIPGAAGVGFALVGLSMFAKGDATAQGEKHQGVLVAGLLASLFLAWAMYAYFHPPPLDLARISTEDGKTRNAKLLYSSNEVLYLVGSEDEKSGHRRIEEIPFDSVRSVEISDGTPRRFRNIPELLGIRFWRYSESDGKIELERSPPADSSPWDAFDLPWE